MCDLVPLSGIVCGGRSPGLALSSTSGTSGSHYVLSGCVFLFNLVVISVKSSVLSEETKKQERNKQNPSNP